MQRFKLAFLLLCNLWVIPMEAQEQVAVPLYEDFAAFEKAILQPGNEQVKLVNFWATWCKPCVEELPYFDSAVVRHPDIPLKVILVNLDFNSRVSSLAEPFVARRNVRSAVWHIDDTDPNTWINRVDTSWSGAIPASAFFFNGKKLDFHEGPLTQAELDLIIQRHTAR